MENFMPGRSEAAFRMWRNPKYLKAQSRAKTLWWTNPAHRTLMRKKLIKAWTPERRQKHKGFATKGARRLHRWLGGARAGWRLEHRVDFSFVVDIAYPKLKLVIEVDGKSHDSLKQKVKDQSLDRVLRGFGWSVFRIPETGCRLLPWRNFLN